MNRSLALIGLLCCLSVATANADDPVSRLVHPGLDGKLVYQAYDAEGDTIPDFSNCGYMGGGVRIPNVPAKITLDPNPGAADDTARIQHALDDLAAMPADENGFRGALLLTRGQYRINDALHLRAGGMVLRGQGENEDGTVLIAAGNKQRDLIQIAGSGPPRASGADVPVTDDYVPVGGRTMTLANASEFHVGDSVFVKRAGNEAWIHLLGMDKMTYTKADTKDWQPFDVVADRVIIAIDGNRITIDAPIVCAMDRKWGGGSIVKYSDPGRITQDGVEYLRAVSEYDPSVTAKLRGMTYASDENHAQQAIAFEACKNGWARHVVAMYFFSGVAVIHKDAKWITVQDSQALDPVSVIVGGRRYPFSVMGQLNLFQRCFSRKERHAFVNNGSQESGPDAFVNCTSETNYADSGPHQRWSTGTLWDNVKGVLHSQDREDMGTGHGWAGANDVYWNCTGNITVQAPPTAQNFAIGFIGVKDPPAFPQLHHTDGYYESFGKHVAPMSLYLTQLQDRLGPTALENISTDAPN